MVLRYDVINEDLSDVNNLRIYFSSEESINPYHVVIGSQEGRTKFVKEFIEISNIMNELVALTKHINDYYEKFQENING